MTVHSPTYYRGCQVPKYYYETLEIDLMLDSLYALRSFENLLLKHDGPCNDGQFKLIIDLGITTSPKYGRTLFHFHLWTTKTSLLVTSFCIDTSFRSRISQIYEILF